MYIKLKIFLYLSLLITLNTAYLRKIILNQSPISCYTLRKNQDYENFYEFPACQLKKVEEFFVEEFNDKELFEACLNKHLNLNFTSDFFKHRESCNKKYRFNIFSNFEQNGFSRLNIHKFYDMTRFSSILELKDGEYIYKDKIIPNMGFMIASSAPIGNLEDLVDTPEFKRECGNDNYSENKIQTCLSGNNKNQGKYTKEDTILNFYEKIKFHNIEYIIMLTKLYEKVNDPNCLCMIKADKYFNFDDHETFNILNKDHTTDSGFTVTSTRNNQELLKIIKSNEFFSEEINDLIEVRKLIIRNKKGEIFHTVNHVFFKKWTDHGIPEGIAKKVFFEMVDYVREQLNQNKNVLIHCSAGVGRTGTFIASVLTSNLIRSKKLNLFKLIIQLRKNRSQMIETMEQITLIRENMFRNSLT